MWIVIIILIGIIIVLLARLFFINLSIKNITKQLEDYNNFKTRKKLDIDLVNKNIESLAESINKHIEISKELQINQHNSEEGLKKMISSISHDLRTPLTSIRGYLQMLKKSNISEEKRQKYIDIVDKRSRDLQELINQFFMLSVVQDNQYKVKLESIDLKEVFIEILTSFYDQFTSKNIEPKIEICNEDINILGDYIGVKRVIENLMINISNHSKNEVHITLFKIKDKVELTIIDTLDDKENLEVDNLFNKFYKSDKSRSVNSTGLGLSIVKELMVKMNGDISAHMKDNTLYIKCIWNFNKKFNL